MLNAILNTCREVLNKVIKKFITENTDFEQVSEEQDTFDNIKLVRDKNGELEEYKVVLDLQQLGDIYSYVSYFTENNNELNGMLLRH